MNWQWGSGKEHGGEASICAAMGNPSLRGASLGVTHSVSGNSSSCLVSKPNKLKGSQVGLWWNHTLVCFVIGA